MTSHPRWNRGSTTGMTVRESGYAAPAHQQDVSLHHTERFTLAEVVSFAAGRVFVRRYRDFVVVLSGIIRHTRLFRVKELPHIPADFPGVIFTGHTTMMVNTAARGRQLLLRLLTGFPADVNLHSGKIRPLQDGRIAAAGGADGRTVRFCHAEGSVLNGIHPR